MELKRPNVGEGDADIHDNRRHEEQDQEDERRAEKQRAVEPRPGRETECGGHDEAGGKRRWGAARRRFPAAPPGIAYSQPNLSTIFTLPLSSLFISSSRNSMAFAGVSRPVSTPCRALNRMPL